MEAGSGSGSESVDGDGPADDPGCLRSKMNKTAEILRIYITSSSELPTELAEAGWFSI